MNALTFQVIREGLGYTRDSLAAALSIRERTVRQWELGQVEVPEWAAEFLLEQRDLFVSRAETIADFSTVTVDNNRTARAQAWAAIQINPDLELEYA